MRQNLTDVKFGNCLQTCVAKVLNKELDHVPNFMLHEHHWWCSFVMYLGIHGYSPEFIQDAVPCDGKEYIASLKFDIHSEGVSHAVVMKDGRVVFDPWPNVNYSYDDAIVSGYYNLKEVK